MLQCVACCVRAATCSLHIHTICFLRHCPSKSHVLKCFKFYKLNVAAAAFWGQSVPFFLHQRHFDYPVVEDPHPNGAGWLIHSKTLQSYLTLLGSSQQEETQETCLGTLQNLTANEGIVREEHVCCCYTLTRAEKPHFDLHLCNCSLWLVITLNIFFYQYNL